MLRAESANKWESLERAKAAFEPALIQELARLDDRMRVAGELLQTHIAPSALFGLLEGLTLQTVSFQTFDFSAPDDSHMTIKMQGVAGGVNAIALQADLFSKNGTLSSPIFSNIARSVEGVRFDFTGNVHPGSLRFQQLAASAAAVEIPEETGSFSPFEPSEELP